MSRTALPRWRPVGRVCLAFSGGAAFAEAESDDRRKAPAAHAISVASAGVDASDSAVQLHFNPRADLDPTKLIALLQSDRRFRMNGPDKLRATVQLSGIAARTGFIRQLLQSLT